jgi:hypothetical protein
MVGKYKKNSKYYTNGRNENKYHTNGREIQERKQVSH